MSEVRYIGAREFVERGYLQEVNRQFLHRLGLAMEVRMGEDGDAFGAVWDYRPDAEGMVFADLSDASAVRKAEAVAGEMARHDSVREERFGWAIQPIGDRRDVADPE